MKSRAALLAGVSAFLLAGCAVGPSYVTPKPPPAGAEGFVGAKTSAALSEAPLPDHWWRLYQDPALDDLVRRALIA